MKPKQVAAWDRRRVAVHEAGHVVVARRLGLGAVFADIWPNDDVVDDLLERTWVGCTQVWGLHQLDPTKRRLLGCAGAVAELCWQREFVDPAFWEEAKMMSVSDWRIADCEPGNPDEPCVEAIERLADLLSEGGPLWRDLLWEARFLILGAREEADR